MLWWIALFNYADSQAIFSVFRPLEREMHLSQVQLGLLGSSFAWVYGLRAVRGKIIDRVRHKLGIPAAHELYLNAFSIVFIAIKSFLACSRRGINS